MPYLTPPDVPEERDCRALLIPASTDWLAIFGGALTELSKSWNWQQEGITVDEALAVVEEVLTGFYAGCVNSGCTLPEGFPPFRLNRDGEIEELVNGEWVPPEGIYALPPTPARTEPTADERKCLAAANAANIMQQLYEELSDAWSEGLTFQQFTEFLTALLIALLGTVFGLVVAPLVAIGVLIVGVIYEVLEFITADVWDENFTDMLRCILYNCARDVDEVVHFSYPCMLQKLSEVTNIFDPTFAQIRLFGQIAYIMQILGAQSLDAMGATTEVEEADCSDCPVEWCVVADFSVDDYGFVSACYNFPTATCDATYGSDTWHDNLGATGNGVTRFCLIEIQFPQAYHFTEVATDCFVTGTGGAMTMGAAIYSNSAGGDPHTSVQIPVSNDHYGAVLTLNDDIDYFQFGTNVSPPNGGSAATGHSYTTRVVFRGTGTKPDLPDCED